MGLFAALMTYLVAAALLVGGAVAGLSVLLAPSDMLTARSSAPPLVRAADRSKSPSPAKPEAAAQSQVRIVAPNAANQPSLSLKPSTDPSATVPPQTGDAARVKEQAAAQPVKKKKIARKPAPLREADTTTLGYGPSEQKRRFIFPLDPGW